MDLVVGEDVRAARLVKAIEPAGADACVFSAEDIAGQTVADHERIFGAKVWNMRKTIVKVCLFWLVRAGVLGNENVLEIRADPGTFQTGVLRVGHAVGGKV